MRLSSSSASGILRGIKKYGKKIKKIWVVHVSGMDRRKDIEKIAPGAVYEYPPYEKYYEKHGQKVKVMISNDFRLDEIYEAKSFEWILSNLYYDEEKTLFWIVGNANFYR